MTQPTWTLEKFRRAGRSHIESAQHVLHRVQSARPAEPHIKALSAAYLAHVALECVLKARLLYRNGCACVEDLQKTSPNVYAVLFRGKEGHNLQFIAESLRLPEIMKLEGKPWADDDCWKRIASSQRPYSLRYGGENVTRQAAEQELQRASDIIAAVSSGTKTIPLRTSQHRRRR